MSQDLFVYSSSQLQGVAELAISHALRRGATSASVRVDESDSMSVTVRNAELENFQQQRAKRMRITVHVDGRSGTSHTSDLSEEALRQATEAAHSVAMQTASDPWSALPDKADLAKAPADLDLFHPWNLSVNDALTLGRALESASLHTPAQGCAPVDFPWPVDGALVSNGATVSSTQGQTLLANSNGFCGEQRYSSQGISSSLVASNASGMQAGYWWSAARAAGDLTGVERVGAIAALRTLRRLNAKRLPSGRYPVVFEAPVAATLLEQLLDTISGTAQYRGQSYFQDSQGKSVLAPHVHVDERPRKLRGMASAAFDAEGVATADRRLIHDGVLQTYLLDSYAARRLGLKTTGNAGGPRNVRMHSGMTRVQDTLSVLLTSMGTGVLVTELLGGDVNPVTGDYSQGVAGFWVEDGVILHAVEEITIAGDLPDMFKAIVAIASDELENSPISTGSILIEHMRIAGL